MYHHVAPEEGGVSWTRACGAGRPVVRHGACARVVAPVLGAGLAATAGLVVASAAGPPPGRGPGHAASVHARISSSQVGRHGMPVQAASPVVQMRIAVADNADLSPVTGTGAAPPTPRTGSPSPSSSTTTTTTTGTGGGSVVATTPLHTHVTAISGFRRTAVRTGTGGGSGTRPSPGSARGTAGGPTGVVLPTPTPFPDVQLIPPATLPEPARIIPAATGMGLGTIMGMIIGVLLLGGLAIVRIARRPG